MHIKARAIAAEEITRAEPTVLELLARLVRPVQVAERLGGMPHPEHARTADRFFAGGWHEPQFDAGIRLAAAHAVRFAGCGHHACTKCFRHAVEVEQLTSGGPSPLLDELRCETLTRRDEASNPRQGGELPRRF